MNLTRFVLGVVSSFVFAATSDALSSPLPPTYRLTDLGGVDPSSVGGAKDINQSGQVALNLNGAGYIYDNGALFPPGGFVINNTSFAISDNAKSTWTSLGRAEYWDGHVQITLPTLEPAGFTSGWGVNNDGHVVGASWRSSLGRDRGYVWDGSAMIDLGSLTPSGWSVALAINNGGMIAGSANDLPVRWVNQTIEPLPMPPNATHGTVNAINEKGHAAGYTYRSSGNDLDATLWVDGQAIVLGYLGGRNESVALGLNDHGEVVGEAKFSGTSGNLRAFLFRDNAMHDLTELVGAPGWTLEQAYAINNRGQIVGVGRLAGERRAFLATPVPEPTACATLLSAAVAMLIVQSPRRMQ